MNNRITTANLDAAIDAYAREMGYSRTNYTRDDAGKLHAVPNSVYLDGAYGGYNVSLILEGGGETHPLGDGYMLKRDLYNKIWTAVHAIREYRQQHESK